MTTEPVFTNEQIREDGRNRVARTAGQGGVAAAVVTVGEWAAGLAGWDGALPTAVAGAFVVLLTAAASWWMNLKRINA
jgi:hypothetical protein